MSTWRMAGLNYVNYSSIAARVLRQSLRANAREDAMKRNVSHLKLFYWRNGQQLPLGERPKMEKEKT